MTTLTLDKVITMIQSLRVYDPCPLALWFVDREVEYYQLLAKRGPHEVSMNQYNLPAICGIPLIQFVGDFATEGEFACRPAFCRSPGIWVEMNNGNHVRLVEPSKENNA